MSLYLHYDIITYKYTASLLELNNLGENWVFPSFQGVLAEK